MSIAHFPAPPLRPFGGRLASRYSIALLASLAIGVMVCWAPRYWPVALVQVCLLAIAASLSLHALSGRVPLLLTPPILLMAGIALWPAVQAAAGLSDYRFVTLQAALLWFTNLLALALGTWILPEPGTRDRFLTGLLWFGAAISLLAILQYFTSPERIFWLFLRPGSIGPFIYKNQFAAFVELLFPIAIYKMLDQPRERLVYSTAAAVLFAAVIVSTSRGGAALLILELLAGLLAAAIQRIVSGRQLAVAGFQIVVLLAAGVLAVGWQSIWGHFQEQNTVAVRAQLARSTLHMIEDRPLVGFGLGTWQVVYPQYAVFDNTLFANAAHNDWAQWSADGGIPWALGLLALAVLGTMAAWRSPWALGIPAVFVHSLWDYPAREPVIGFILFVLLGTVLAARRQRRL